VEVWRDAPGIGRNLAIALADVCPEGIGVYLTAAVRPGDAVEVVLTRRGAAPVRVPAEVRWCAEGEDWTYRAGLRLRWPLGYQDMADLTV
jgi:PilZ domain